jgi:hypothetical protein
VLRGEGDILKGIKASLRMGRNLQRHYFAKRAF